MDHEHTTTPTEPKPEANEKPPALTLRIPKPNWQVTALILIAVIAGFQTIQLARLKDNVTAKASTTSAGTTPTPSASSDSGLQPQVGGC
ncbi:MAG: hypothetical protein HYY50_03705 [Candidatus Kerfeldbacteria bacterium]|nr:hypothetical protein [Candidatus Kerfeldbacteria bacterium]